jgi:hypothetical protein
VLPCADSEDDDVIAVATPAEPAAHAGATLGAAHVHPHAPEPAAKRARTQHSKRAPNAVEEIAPISTVAEQQLCQQLFFPGTTSLPEPSALPTKLPDFTKMAVKFNERVVAQRQAAQSTQVNACCGICFLSHIYMPRNRMH